MSNKTKVLLSRHNANGVCIAHTSTPSLNTDDTVTLVEDAQLDGLANAPLETLVNILLPVRAAEIRLRLWEVEGINATIQMGVSSGRWISGDHDDGTDWAVFGENASGVATKRLSA